MNRKNMKKTTSSKSNKKQKKSRNWFWIIFVIFLQIFLVAAILIGIYGYHLNEQIKERIDGKVWDLPAAVYGKIVELEPGSGYRINEVEQLLKFSQYQKVSNIMRPGEYSVDKNMISLYRRPFIYPDKEEEAMKVALTFSDENLENIKNIDNGRQYGFFRVDPRLITMLRSVSDELRLFVPLSDFPETLVASLLATEDRQFYEHFGVNPIAIVRAITVNFSSGQRKQGGSTLTQQLVKNLFLTNERSYKRKIREAYMAILLEMNYSKERILELYLNEVFFGQDGDKAIHGFPLASQFYFNRNVSELTLDQQAVLVGIVKGASYYNPRRYPERVLERRNVVLNVMEEQKIIDHELNDQLKKRKLEIVERDAVLSPHPGFMQLVRQELQQKLGEKVKSLSGAKIFTTFDSIAQESAEKAVIDGIGKLRKSSKKPKLETAMVIVDRVSGEIKAIVGGADPQYPGFNRALIAKRSIGSLAKMPTYLTALSEPNKYRLNSVIEDQPLSVPLPNGTTWEPRNTDRQFRGSVLLMDALAKSLNVPTVNVGLDLGLNKTRETLMQLGIPSEDIQQVPARLLGAIDLTLFQVAQMYQTVGNIGNLSPLTSIRSVLGEKGESIYQTYPKSMSVVSPEGAYLTVFALQRAVTDGTARSIKTEFGKYHIAGKTGSTNDWRDSWFVGIDGENVVVTWVGLDDFKPINLSGSAGALQVYKRLLEIQKPVAFYPIIPKGIQMIDINSSGNFVCQGGIAKIPVWVDERNNLCQESELFIEQMELEQQKSNHTFPDNNENQPESIQTENQFEEEFIIEENIENPLIVEQTENETNFGESSNNQTDQSIEKPKNVEFNLPSIEEKLKNSSLSSKSSEDDLKTLLNEDEKRRKEEQKKQLTTENWIENHSTNSTLEEKKEDPLKIFIEEKSEKDAVIKSNAIFSPAEIKLENDLNSTLIEPQIQSETKDENYAEKLFN